MLLKDFIHLYGIHCVLCENSRSFSKYDQKNEIIQLRRVEASQQAQQKRNVQIILFVLPYFVSVRKVLRFPIIFTNVDFQAIYSYAKGVSHSTPLR